MNTKPFYNIAQYFIKPWHKNTALSIYNPFISFELPLFYYKASSRPNKKLLLGSGQKKQTHKLTLVNLAQQYLEIVQQHKHTSYNYKITVVPGFTVKGCS